MKNGRYMLLATFLAHTAMYGAATSSTSSSSSGIPVANVISARAKSSPLLSAIIKNTRGKADPATIKDLLEKGADIFQKVTTSPNTIVTPLEWAIDSTPEIFELLLNSLRDQNLINTEKTQQGRTYLSNATLNAVNQEIVREKDPTTDSIDNSSNAIAILRLLLDFGADTNISDDNGENAFLCAHRHPTVLQVFTDYETRRKDMLNASDAGNRLSPPGICTLILSYGTAVSSSSSSSSSFSSSSSSSSSSSHPMSTAIPSRIQKVVSPNPLHNAFLWDNQATMKELLEKGEDPTQLFSQNNDNKASTVLHSVCNFWLESSYSMLELLLRYLNPDRINIQNSTGETPLIVAVQCAVIMTTVYAKEEAANVAPAPSLLLPSRSEVESYKKNRWQLHVNKITLLLSCGADPRITDNDGHDALYYANQCPAVLKIFTDYEMQQKAASSSSSSSSSSTLR